jgi:hypothetical protein
MTGHSPSAGQHLRPPMSKFALSPRRIVCRPSQSDSWWAASRILPCARPHIPDFFADDKGRCAGIVSAPPTHSGAEEQWPRRTPRRRSHSVRLFSAASSCREGTALRDQSRSDC